jgi:hypothetical protein
MEGINKLYNDLKLNPFASRLWEILVMKESNSSIDIWKSIVATVHRSVHVTGKSGGGRGFVGM